MAVNGFKVSPSELTAAARRLATQADGLSTLRGEVAAVPVPSPVFGHVAGSSALQSAMNRCVESVSFDLECAATEVRRIGEVDAFAADTYTRTDAELADRYRALLKARRRVRHH